MDTSTSSLRRGRFYITNEPAEVESAAIAFRREDSHSISFNEEAKLEPRAVDSKEEGKAKHAAVKPIEEEKTKAYRQPDPEVAKTMSPPTIAVEPPVDAEPPEAFHGALVSSLNAWSSKKSKREPVAKGATESASVPLNVFLSYNTTISTQFTAMLQLHREIMLELIHRDSKRDEQSLLLCQENAALARQVAGLEAENRSIRDSVYRIKE